MNPASSSCRRRPRPVRSPARWRRPATSWCWCAATGRSLRRALGEAEYVLCYPSLTMKDAFYQAAPRLRLVQLLSAGYDNVDLEAARRAQVPIANNGGANAISVAEHALMLMLTVSRRLIWTHASVAAGRWRGSRPLRACTSSSTRRSASSGSAPSARRWLGWRAFGMRVEYYDIARLNEDAEDALGVRFRLLRELLRRADVISLHVPLNATTRHMIGESELALMKREAILINTCRGPVVDEAALSARSPTGRCSAPASTCSTRSRRRPAIRCSSSTTWCCRRISPGRPGITTWRASATASTTSSGWRAASRRCGWCRSWRMWWAAGRRGNRLCSFLVGLLVLPRFTWSAAQARQRGARGARQVRAARTSKISRTCSFLQGSLQLNRQNRLANESNRLA